MKLLITVRCLECGASYGKPQSGSIADTNPGCPVCGYVGWIPTAAPRRAGAAVVVGRPARGLRQRG
ncbi:MAG: hypothetical protein JOY72_09055 [Actinobacteria bacterium]|nr:hypothetical protein [Actinomycetota bacterium]MBV8480436.1 hypothetical protein [Actinomycetota bacterium]